MKSTLLHAAQQLAYQRHQGDSSGHDPFHVERVVKLSLQLANSFPQVDVTLVEVLAWLHDIDDRKLIQRDNHLTVHEFLLQQSVSSSDIELIDHELGSMSFTATMQGKKVSTLEAQLVQDADRLDAIGAIGIARVFAYGGYKNRPIDDKGNSGQSSLDHFEDKLFKLAALMNTAPAKALADERTAFMREFVRRFKEEQGD